MKIDCGFEKLMRQKKKHRKETIVDSEGELSRMLKGISILPVQQKWLNQPKKLTDQYFQTEVWYHWDCTETSGTTISPAGIGLKRINTVKQLKSNSNVSSDGCTQGGLLEWCVSQSRGVTFCLAADRGRSHYPEALHLELQPLVRLMEQTNKKNKNK